MELLADRSGRNRKILKNVPQDAGEIQIILETNFGKSEWSESVKIECGFKGCEKKDSVGVIVGGIIGACVFVCLIAGFIYYKRF